jgi:hypothetical protein
MQEHFDTAPFTGLIIDRLAWHTERWMKAAFAHGAHERALILAAHASALEQHAARLNLKTDYIAYIRGNLAAVQFRRDRRDQAIPLLRSEIEHYRGRDEEHARLLTCQASMQLAVVLADQTAAAPGDIASHLETAYLIIIDRVLEHPEAAAFLIATLRSILTQLELNDIRDERLAMLATAVDDVAGRLPRTPQSAAIRAHDEIDVCMNEHDCARAADLARTLLSGDFLATEHDGDPGGTPGTRCVPACWQLHGALRSPRRSCSASRGGGVRHRHGRGHPGQKRAEDRHDQRGHRADQRQGLRPLHIRPGHHRRIKVLRVLRRGLVPGASASQGRSRRHRQTGHHHAGRRRASGHLRRASAVHLGRRLQPGPGRRERRRPERRSLGRGPGIRRLTPHRGLPRAAQATAAASRRQGKIPSSPGPALIVGSRHDRSVAYGLQRVAPGQN